MPSLFVKLATFATLAVGALGAYVEDQVDAGNGVHVPGAYCAYRPTYSFKTALAAGDWTPFTIATIADLGLMGHDGLSTTVGPLGGAFRALGPNETNTIQSMIALRDTYEFVGHYGDIGYADYFLKESTHAYFGNSSELTNPSREQVAIRCPWASFCCVRLSLTLPKDESLSEQFFDQMQPITASKPWMVTPGNHEANCDNGLKGYGDAYCLIGQTNFTFYIEHFRMPSQQSHKTNNFWYSYDVGMAHFISLDTETDLGHGLVAPIANISTNHNGPFGGLNEQVDWLVEDLKSVDRTKTPRPWYTQVSPPTWPAWQEAFEQIFYDYEVDLYMNGHVHTYERMHPIFNGTIDPNGLNNPRAPWMLLLGAAGHYDGLDVFSTNQSYTAFGDDEHFGWGRLTFDNATHLSFEYINSADSQVLDRATLYKEHKSSFPAESSAETLLATAVEELEKLQAELKLAEANVATRKAAVDAEHAAPVGVRVPRGRTL
ncbi:hypothetical protein RQP46_009009 [Phenoliferia psychrophenolica]